VSRGRGYLLIRDFARREEMFIEKECRLKNEDRITLVLEYEQRI
jgi:hypothetical protein